MNRENDELMDISESGYVHSSKKNGRMPKAQQQLTTPVFFKQTINYIHFTQALWF